MSLKDMGNTIARGINKNADLILTGSALLGLTATTILAIRETPRAMDILDDSRYRISRINDSVNKKKKDPEDAGDEIKRIRLETAKDLGLNYLPTAISFATTAGCIIGSNKVSRSRNAALSNALNAANLMYSEYREAVRDKIGEKKEHEVHDSVRESHIQKNPPSDMPENIYKTGKGDTLCHIELLPGDPDTGIYFYSSPEAVMAGINDANAEGINSGYVSMADVLYFQGITLKGSGSQLIGWQITSRNDLIQVRRSSHLYNDKPVLDISFYNMPYKNFDRFG